MVVEIWFQIPKVIDRCSFDFDRHLLRHQICFAHVTIYQSQSSTIKKKCHTRRNHQLKKGHIFVFT